MPIASLCEQRERTLSGCVGCDSIFCSAAGAAVSGLLPGAGGRSGLSGATRRQECHEQSPCAQHPYSIPAGARQCQSVASW